MIGVVVNPKNLFDKGAHSHIRAVTPELYDKAIQDFLKENNL